MGCDIHMRAEIKQKYSNTEYKWRCVGGVFKDPYFDEKLPTIIHSEGYIKNTAGRIEPYDRRNYTLFGFLANVRNGRGFAGSDTGNAIIPISMPKGYPKDISDYAKKESDEYGSDGHSHTYLTLDELVNADWDQKICRRGYVTEEVYKKDILKGRDPSYRNSGITGNRIITLTEEEYKCLKVKDNEKDYYILVEWYPVLKEYCKYFYTETIPQLQKLLALEGVCDVRIVFFFDN